MSAFDGLLYTNRDDAWLDFALRGLEVIDGRLVLARLPAPMQALPAGLASLPAPTAPAGLAVAADGAVYATSGDTVVRIDGCDGTFAPAPCFGGTGYAPTQLSGPTGLLVHPGRNALVVSDTGNSRLQLFRLGSGQLVDVWEFPGDLPGALAADDEGYVYVADQGNHRVQRLTPGGWVVPGFAERAGTFDEPVAIATRSGEDGTVVHVLDHGTIVTLGTAGEQLGRLQLAGLGKVAGLAVWGDGFVVGDDQAGGRVLRLGPDGDVIGAAPGWTGPVAALATGPDGALWVHPGGSSPPVRLEAAAGHVREGVAWGGPFGRFNNLVKTWQRLSATTPGRQQDAHLQFFVHTAADAPAPPPPVTGTGPDAFADPAWSAGPADAPDLLIDAPPGRVAWIGVRLNGSGWVSVEVEQVRLTFDRPGYVPLLPAIYGDAASGAGAVLNRFLAAVESTFDEVEGRIRDLSRLDPAAADTLFRSELARWLDLPASAGQDDIVAAYPATARYGTAAGLQEALRTALAAPVVVEEPLVQASWWALADETASEAEQDASRLGAMLAAGEPQGGVLGSTALVDGSNLITDDEFGTPLFEPLAHRFTIRVYAGCSDSPQNRAVVEGLIERERPADSEYHICRIEPGLCLGLGGRIGIDTVVGGEPLSARIEQSNRIGVDTEL